MKWYIWGVSEFRERDRKGVIIEVYFDINVFLVWGLKIYIMLDGF